jgi:short-subunit dehydrogenase
VGKLDSKAVFITGASSGIGAALARRCAAEGARVALTARRLDRLAALEAEIREGGGQAVAIEADVTRDGDLELAAAIAREALGGIDVVVANAGFGVAGKLARLTLADYQRQMETNFFGVLRTVYATVDDLRRSRGTLVIVGSVAGYLSAPGNSAYTASKFAVHGLAQSLRSELAAEGIAVVLIAPGFVETEIQRVDNEGKLRAEPRDVIPSWLLMPADAAAREIVEAIAAGERERVVTLHGKVAVALVRHAPGLVAAAMKLVGKRGR